MQSQITTNTTNISTNTTNISTNTSDIANIVNNTTKITNATEGFSGGANSSAEEGGAIGNDANTTSGGSVGQGSSSELGGSVGTLSKSVEGGFSGGAMATSDVDSIQLGTGNNSIAKSLQIYDDNIYNASTHTLTVQNATIGDTDISTLASTVATNSTNIETNKSNIDINANNITNLTTQVETNTNNITTNTTNIATNTNNISTLQTSKQNTLTAGNNIIIENDVISAAALSVTIDDALSTTSENPVQNKVITSSIESLETADTNNVKLTGDQTINGVKTFNTPTNVDGTEQTTTKFMTSNGGSITIGKEAENSGTMLRMDQEDGTARLRFRTSSTAGAVVWSQPESGSRLFFDFVDSDGETYRVNSPTIAGTLLTDTNGVTLSTLQTIYASKTFNSTLNTSTLQPRTSETYDLGSSSLLYKDLYLSGTMNSGSAIINGDLTVAGNITQEGSTYETHAEQVYSTKDYIYLREGQTGALTDGTYTGLEFIKYDGTNNGRLVVDNTGVARVGDIGDEQPLATREETPIDQALAYWDSTNTKFATTETCTLSTVVYHEDGDSTTDVNIVNGSNPNLLINGDFRVNQRGNSSYTFASSGFLRQYCVDRFVMVQQTSGTGGSSGSKIVVNDDNSLTIYFVEQYFNFGQQIEDYQPLLGKTVTLSVYVSENNMSAETGLRIGNRATNTYTLTNIPAGQTGIFSHTTTIPESYTTLVCGLVNNTTTSGNLTIKYIKLEVGSVPTAFSPRPYAEELAMCQRYYLPLSSQIIRSTVYSSSGINFFIPIPMTLRTLPTLTLGSGSGIQAISGGSVTTTYTFSPLTPTKTNCVHVRATLSGATYTDSCFNIQSGTSFDAEIY